MDTSNASVSFMEFENTNRSNNLSEDYEIQFFDKTVQVNKEFKPIIDYLLLVILILIMLSMGCEITWIELKYHILKPIGIVIGMVSQFLVMPLAAFSLLRSIGITGLHATGVLIISCCPGGVLSNAFTYYAEGDLSLSVAMTSFSTLLAMGMMPLNLWLYGRSFESKDLSLPYSKLALSLVSVTSPVVVGMLLRWKLPKVAHYVTKIGSLLGLGLIVVCMVLEVIVFPNMFTDIPGKLYGVILPLPFIGMCLGYILAFAFKQNMKVRKTIAIECGVQNVPTALTVVSLSFKSEFQGDIILLPWLYGFAMITFSAILITVYQIHKRYSTAKKEEKEVPKTIKTESIHKENGIEEKGR